MTSQIRLCIEYLIPTCNITMLFRSKFGSKNRTLLAGFDTISWYYSVGGLTFLGHLAELSGGMNPITLDWIESKNATYTADVRWTVDAVWQWLKGNDDINGGALCSKYRLQRSLRLATLAAITAREDGALSILTPPRYKLRHPIVTVYSRHFVIGYDSPSTLLKPPICLRNTFCYEWSKVMKNECVWKWKLF